MSGELTAQLQPIVAQAVENSGFDLDELNVRDGGRQKVVKVVVDSDTGVALDDIADISKTLSSVLDDHDHLLVGAYTLEVTSPGIDRPLTHVRHWRRAKYRLVRITLTDDSELLARVGKAGDDSVRVLCDGAVRSVAYSDVAKALVEVEFKQPSSADLKLLDNDD